jgi:hypothetical protein
MDEDVTQAQLPGLVKEWMTLKDTLQTLSAEVKEKRKRMKLVSGMIQTIMKKNKLGQLKTSAGAVMTRTKQTKVPMSKKFLLSTLTDFFKGNAEMAKACAEFLDQHRPLKAAESLSLEATE